LQGGSEDAGRHAIASADATQSVLVKNLLRLHVCGYDLEPAADGLAGEDLAEMIFCRLKSDATAGRYSDSLVMEGIGPRSLQVSILPG